MSNMFLNHFRRTKTKITYAPRPGEKSRTIQSQKEDADINVIVRRFGVTGQLPNNVRAPQFGDFTEVHDFHSAMDAIVAAQRLFDALPAEVRKRFHNDPQELLEFCADASNVEEMIKLGLATKREDVIMETPKTSETKDVGTKDNSGTGAGSGASPSGNGA